MKELGVRPGKNEFVIYDPTKQEYSPVALVDSDGYWEKGERHTDKWGLAPVIFNEQSYQFIAHASILVGPDEQSFRKVTNTDGAKKFLLQSSSVFPGLSQASKTEILNQGITLVRGSRQETIR